MTAPTDASVLAAHQLAGLAALEAGLVFAIRATRRTYPPINKLRPSNEPPELATARDFVDQCELLLAALNAHWNALATGLHDDGPVPHEEDHDIPF